MDRRWLTVVIVALMLSALTIGAASAAPKTGCPAGEDWTESTATDAGATIWPALLDPSPWPDAAAFAEFLDAAYDRNGDDSVCAKTLWGGDLNPNSHWYRVGLELIGEPAQLFVVRDNNANGSNR